MGTAKRSLFPGSAAALAGQVRRPDDLIIAIQAPLPEASGQQLGRIVSFGSGKKSISFTEGQNGETESAGEALANVRVRDLAVVNQGAATLPKMICAAVEAQLTHNTALDGKPACIKITGTRLDGLALNGYGLRVVFHEKMFSDYDTKDKLCKAYETDETFFRSFGTLFFVPPGARQPKAGVRRKTPQADGEIYCTIIQSIEWTGEALAGVRIDGNRITWPDFGSIYLGVIRISDFSRRLTMMRLQLGSTESGNTRALEVESDGHGWPP